MKFTESALEDAVLEYFSSLGYQTTFGPDLHRDSREVLLVEDLRSYLSSNYSDLDLTHTEMDSIVRHIRAQLSGDLYSANSRINELVSNGFIFDRDGDQRESVFIRLVNSANPHSNVFRVVNQFEVLGSQKRIPDAVVFINGLPLVVFEFKSAIDERATIFDAHKQLTVRYKRDIPELLKFNSLVVISDGANTKMGSIFAEYDYFYAWRKVSATKKQSDGVGTLDSMMQGLFTKERLVDVVTNFIYFPDQSTSNEKYVCRYPQYFAARALFDSIRQSMQPLGDGRGGTYFGATGSGKSLTMLYLTRLLMRSGELANPTILLVTDRTDLDDQLSQQFVRAKSYIGDENIVSVASRDDLKSRLGDIQSGGVFLTTVQKFTENTQLLSSRTNIICISDEAHRTQINLEQKTRIADDGVTTGYGFAKYLRDSLPNATYVGVTGTPVDGTLEVFGPIRDSYTLRDSVVDQITVPITYEGRAARVSLDEDKLEEIERFYAQCQVDGSSEDQIEKSKRAVANLNLILGDQSRIERLADDFVYHYEKRSTERISVADKAIFVCSSREIAWNFYKQVIKLRPSWGPGSPENSTHQPQSDAKVRMVMTRNKDDAQELYDALGPSDYRKKLDIEFKKPDSSFKIAIVVDMWLTGFDVPSLDVIYIDKAIQKHSLIQTISRVNRVFPGKEAGLVVDYIGLKSSLNEALAMYGDTVENSFDDSAKALVVFRDHLELLDSLFWAFDSTDYFHGTPLERLRSLNRAVEFVQQTDALQERFKSLIATCKSAYSLCATSPQIANEERDSLHFYLAIRSILAKLTAGDALDVSAMNSRVTQMIEDALTSDGIESIVSLDGEKVTEVLNLLDEDHLQAINSIDRPNTKFKLLEKLLRSTLQEFRKTNLSKFVDFSKRLKQIVDAYNQRTEFEVMQSHVLDELAERLTELFNELRDEQKRSDELGVTYEERAFFDILKSIAEKYSFEFPEGKITELAKRVKSVVDDKSRYTDWAKKADVKAELRVGLILLLDEFGYPPVPKDEIFREIFEQAEHFKAHAGK
jgi:type I restriction enzyme R subunit